MSRGPTSTTRTDTLFPYTTLFRSATSETWTTWPERRTPAATSASAAPRLGREWGITGSRTTLPSASPDVNEEPEGHEPLRAPDPALDPPEDRKSTRLNSSH